MAIIEVTSKDETQDISLRAKGEIDRAGLGIETFGPGGLSAEMKDGKVIVWKDNADPRVFAIVLPQPPDVIVRWVGCPSEKQPEVFLWLGEELLRRLFVNAIFAPGFPLAENAARLTGAKLERDGLYHISIATAVAKLRLLPIVNAGHI